MFKLDPQNPQWSRQFVDPHFSRAPSLDRRDPLFIGEKFSFGKIGVATYFIFILKGKIKKERNPKEVTP